MFPFYRIRMYRLLRELISIRHKIDSDYIDGASLDSLNLSGKRLEALRLLSEYKAVDLDEGSGEIVSIHIPSGAYKYLLKRSDLWFDRIVTFLSGVAATLIIQAIIRFFFP